MNIETQNRFFKFVTKTPSCWLWEGAISGSGYGSFTANGKANLCHRFIYEMFCGSVPDNMVVCHTCDNKLCVNPTHLVVATQQQNIANKVEKERQARGESHGNVVLCAEQVIKIRKLLDEGYKQDYLAKLFGVKQGCISKIKYRRTWTHI